MSLLYLSNGNLVFKISRLLYIIKYSFSNQKKKQYNRREHWSERLGLGLGLKRLLMATYYRNYVGRYHDDQNCRNVWRKEKEGVRGESMRRRSPLSPHQSTIQKLCKFWASGNCVKGDRCRYLHSWCHGDHSSFLTSLQGHKKVPFLIIFVSCFLI